MTRRRLSVVMAAVLVLSFSFGVLAADVFGGERNAHNGGTAPPADGPVTPAVPSRSASSVPPARTPVPQPPDEATTGQVRWDATLAVPLPVSATQGPLTLTSDFAGSFGPTRLGAAIAAAHLLARTSPRVGPVVFTSTIELQVRGPNRQALAGAVRSAYDDEARQLGLVGGDPLPGADAQLVGYRMVHFTPSDAVVEVVLSSTALRVDGQVVVVRVSLQRSDDDWVLVAPPRGDWGVVTTVLPGRPADTVAYVEEP